jgi:hypothetical protein
MGENMDRQTDENDVPDIPDTLDAPDGDAENSSTAVQASNEESGETTGAAPRPSTLISLGGYSNDDYLTKKELCAVFKCGARTLQRMVDRFEIPPPVWFAGRNTWIVGNLRTWIAEAAKRKEAGALRVAKKMRVFNY